MNRIQKAAVSTKNFVVNHKVVVTFAATALVATAVNRSALRQHDDFLKEHGLYETFYTPEDSY